MGNQSTSILDYWKPRIWNLTQSLNDEGEIIKEETVDNLIDNNTKW